jgi:starch synthase
VRVLHAATELFPLLKVGGLADVVAALPAAQARRGHDVRLLLPGLPSVRQGLEGARPAPGWRGPGTLWKGRTPAGLEAYALELPPWFEGQESPYAHRRDDAGGFAAFARTAAVLAAEGDGEGNGRGWRADLLHLHDWPTALAASHLARRPGARPATVLTVHNAAFQGLFPAEVFPGLGLPAEAFAPEGLEFHGQVNLLKAGLVDADRIATVSPTYAGELRTPEGGAGLHGVFARRAGDLHGILNGVDLAAWDPARDTALPAPVATGRVEGRAQNKAALQRAFGLDARPRTPLFAVVSRLDTLKGLDLLLANAGLLEALDAQLAVLGQGDPGLETAFEALGRAQPGRAGWIRRRDEALARLAFGGADFLLVPSRSEPCGLTQLYAQRYGAVPVVRRTGGLADTVADGPGATGLLFGEATAEALGEALRRACGMYRQDPGAYAAVQARAMALERGWDGPARAYDALYQDLVPA